MSVDVKLDQIWHLRNIRESDARWELSTNYKVPIEDRVLRGMLQASTDPPIRLRDHPRVLGLVRVLVKELRSLFEQQVDVTEGAYTVHGRRDLDRLMRKLTAPGRKNVLICVGDVIGPHGRNVQEFQEEPLVRDLSSASIAAISALDRLAVATCARMFGEKVRALDRYPPEAIPTARNVSVFIAYRRTHFDAATRLHAVLSEADHHTLFDPYLDYHDMRLGDWRPQIFDRIEKTDIFMPIVTADYAEPGSFGHEEFTRAKEVAARRRLDDFFASVFLGNVWSAAGQELRGFHGIEIASASELTSTNEKLDHWFARVVSAGFGRDI